MPLPERLSDRLLLAHLAVLLCLCAVMAVSISVPLRNALEFVSSNTVITISLYALVSYALYALCCLPLHYTQQRGSLLRDGLAPDAVAWLKSHARQEGFNALWYMFALQIIYLYLQSSSFWWIRVALFMVVLAALRQIAFGWVIPLLMKWPKVADRELVQRLSGLAKRLGIKVEDVYQSALPNPDILNNGAFLVRLGKKARVVISSAVAQFSPAEIEALLARDLGQHHYHIHLKRALAQVLGVIALCAGVGLSFAPLARLLRFSPITDIATVPLIVALVVVCGVPLRVLVNAFLSGFEQDADHFALQLTRAPDALVSVLVRRSLGEDTSAAPRSWFMRLLRSAEPPLDQRLAVAQAFADELLFTSRRG